MYFFLQNNTEVQVLCHHNLRTRRLQHREWTGSNQFYFGPDCIYHFSPEPFLVNYAQSLSVIIHFFINSCIFLTVFPSQELLLWQQNPPTLIPWEWPQRCEWGTIEWGSLHLSPIFLSESIQIIAQPAWLPGIPILKIYASMISQKQYTEFKTTNSRWQMSKFC